MSEKLPAGIADDGFQLHNMSIRGDEEDAVPAVTKFLYRDAGNAVRYLIGHTPFKDEMHHGSVRLYRDETEEVRVHNELYAGDWWWNIQQTPKWIYVYYSSYIGGQDTTNDTAWRHIMLAGVPVYWKSQPRRA